MFDSSAIQPQRRLQRTAEQIVTPESDAHSVVMPTNAGVYEHSNLTRSQLQIWMGQNLLPEIPIYNLAVGLSLNGEIEYRHFINSFQSLVNSSDALRTVLEEIDGIPLQRVVPSLQYTMSVLDFSREVCPRSTAKRWMETRSQSPFNWQKCLFDSALIKVSDKEFVWYLNIHHLICDGWSFELIYRQMAELYRRALQGCLPESVGLLPFADYLAYEKTYRESPRHRRSDLYWKSLLAESGEKIGFYGKAPDKTTTRVRRVSWDLGAERTRKLRALAATVAPGTDQASLLHCFGAILIAYLNFLNGKQSYTIGIPFHNRRSKQFKDTIGFFSELLPVRIDLSEDESLSSLTDKFRSEVFKAARHGQYAIANPYFKRVYDVVLNHHVRSFSDFAGIPAFPQWIHNGHGDESLAIQVSDFGSSSSLSIDFDLHQAVFSERESERVIDHFSRLVDVFLADPAQQLCDLSLISSEEREQVVQCSEAETEPLPGCCVHQLFEEQAKARPDVCALVCEDIQVSYEELNRRANQVAHYLLKRGVGPETMVGLYVERSPEMIVGLLGILKAGAAYVPIHPEYPEEWVTFVLKDAGIRILLTQRNLLDSLPQDGFEVLVLDGSDEVLSSESGEDVESRVTGDHLAYVIYTSGSTGRPKGVEITHRSLLNFTLQAAGIFGLGSGDRVLQFASIGFDTSVEEIFPCLMRGATLVLRTDAMLASAPAFLDKCGEMRITVLDLPTSYWHELASALFLDRLALPASLRVVIIGGERVVPEKVALWQACVSRRVKLFNTYGPTETTVAATVYDLTDFPADKGASAEIPIGSSIVNVQTYVLDRNLKPVAFGVTGELYIGGAGVARGYLNQAALTAEKFLRNPFSANRESRLFKTGDLVRYLSDGNLEFLGRLDRQIKVRGFRVELEGIEAVLQKHPMVEDAAVILDDAETQKRVVGYLVPKRGAALNTADLKYFISTKLPEYMVPETIVFLDSLPLTPNGKVDRRALPVPENSQVRPARVLVPPQTPTEKNIADLWCEVLGVDAVGRMDHFFELGGQSLLAAQIVSRIRKELRVDIPLRLIFEAPTVAQLAGRIDETVSLKNDRPDIASRLPSHRGGSLPVSQAQARIWYMHQLAPESSAYNIATPMRFTGVFNKEALTRSLEQVFQRHESFRTIFRNKDGEPVQIISEALTLQMPESDLRAIPEDCRMDEAKRILREEARRPFDLEQGPLIRVMLIRLADEDHVFSLNMHHVISDQWSLGVVAKEVTVLYNGYCQSSSPSLAGSESQYADFALWQNQRLSPERINGQLQYWKMRLADLEPLVLPADRPRPAVQTFHGAYQSLDISTAFLERVRKQAAQENATLYMFFLAAFNVLLSRYSGQHDIAIGSPVANRNRVEWEGVVGTFINLLVIRTDLSGNPSFRQILQRVRDVVLDAFSNADLPFESLVKELQCGRDSSRSPLIQVLFNFQSVPMKKLDLHGLSWMPFEIDQAAAQFDLSVTVDPEVTRKIVIVYNTDLYDADTITRMLQHYQKLLENLAADPDRSAATAPILADSERQQLLRDWNDNQCTFPRACIHELFESQTRKTPDSIALVFEDERMTYKELDRRADQMAERLRAMGVKPEVLVGVCLERSTGLVVALLAVLKAGGAYVPIDPAYPRERIAFMLEDSGIAVLLTTEKLQSSLPKNGHSTLCMDKMREDATPETVGTYEPVQPDNLAYVIYTSGSTGKPKGVAIEHRSLINFLNSMKKKPGIAESDVLLSVTTVSFDIAALEIFLPLIVGARVVLTSRETAADGRRLRQLIVASGATMMQATPTTWRMLTEAGWEGAEGFKVLCGGESLPLALARNLLNGGNSVWNLYGPTETTVWSTACEVALNRGCISIGRPIDNTCLYILDANMEPVPIGIPGDIYIGGQGVARGYWKREELTAEKFVRDPYDEDCQARLFKTGDFGRFLADGHVECLGRIDQQLKIRGHRIEAGEIEVTLTTHPMVRQALVMGKELADGTADMQLVAYLVVSQSAHFDQDELRNFLKRKLPDYMVPSVFIPLEALPIAPGGKINRSALPTPDPRGCYPAKPFVAPRNRLELQLAQIWQLTLNLKPIGVKDSFFELGGHSLTTVKLVAQIRKHLAIDLPISAVFAAPTIEQLAVLVCEEGWVAPKNCIIEIQPAGSKPPLFLIGAEQALARHLDREQPIYALSFLGMLETDVPSIRLMDIAENFVRSIRSVQPTGPYHLAGYSSGGVVAFEVAQLLVTDGDEVALLALLDTYGPGTRSLPFIEKLAAHWRALKSRERIKRLNYLLYLLKKVVNNIKESDEPFGLFNSLSFSRRYSSLTIKSIKRLFHSALRNHVPQVFRGRGVLLRSQAVVATCYDDVDRGWTGLFEGGLDIHEVPGDHRTMLDDPNARQVADRLQQCLDKAQQNRLPMGESSRSSILRANVNTTSR